MKKLITLVLLAGLAIGTGAPAVAAPADTVTTAQIATTAGGNEWG